MATSLLAHDVGSISGGRLDSNQHGDLPVCPSVTLPLGTFTPLTARPTVSRPPLLLEPAYTRALGNTCGLVQQSSELDIDPATLAVVALLDSVEPRSKRDFKSRAQPPLPTWQQHVASSPE